MQAAQQAAGAENLGLAGAKGAAAVAGKGLAAGAGSRRALGDIGNVVGAFNQKVTVGKEGEAKAAQGRPGVLTRRAAAQLAAAGNGNAQAANAGSWGATKPHKGLRPRDSNVPVVSQQAAAAAAEKPAAAGRSMSQLLQSRSEAAVSGGKTKKQCVPALPDIDTADAADPLNATDFVADIFSYYKRVEPQLRVAPDYMTRQTDINDKMRAILIDWLVDVHLKFKLMPETLYLTVDLIDRFLEAKQVTRKHLQLVGVTAMLVASKYEEIWAPEVRDFVYISDRAYTRDQILNMEKIMLNALRFNLTVPSIYNFLGRNFKAAGVVNNQDVTLLSTYLVELSLVDYSSLKYPYSMIAAAATYVALKAVGAADAFPVALERHSGYNVASVQTCALHLAGLMRKAPNSSLVAVYKKYANEKLQRIATTYEAPADSELLGYAQ
ncbi:hypothetical protein COHA_003876 [Chlorella ohadii]|uniref:B-type cyclin n=1 Tax=Chlorella ohadii TaxID=2649997 RepID=A0AAD5DQR9_9CHLO|nr:hypothetical protein COHA_003876 [Chlorella ohadii]